MMICIEKVLFKDYIKNYIMKSKTKIVKFLKGMIDQREKMEIMVDPSKI